MPAARRRSGRSPKSAQDRAATTTTWKFATTVAKPAPTSSDGVLPRDQVEGEADPGRHGQATVASRARSERAVLTEHEHEQERQRERAAEDGRGRRGLAGVAEEDPRERDERRPDDRGQPRPGDDRGGEQADPGADPARPRRSVTASGR